MPSNDDPSHPLTICAIQWQPLSFSDNPCRPVMLHAVRRPVRARRAAGVCINRRLSGGTACVGPDSGQPGGPHGRPGAEAVCPGRRSAPDQGSGVRRYTLTTSSSAAVLLPPLGPAECVVPGQSAVLVPCRGRTGVGASRAAAGRTGTAAAGQPMFGSRQKHEPESLHLAPRTPHPAPCIQHPAPRIQHPAPCTYHLALGNHYPASSTRTQHPSSIILHPTPNSHYPAPGTRRPAPNFSIL